MKYVLLLALLSGCGDQGWYTPTTEITVSRKGCYSTRSQGSQVIVNITAERLPNGEMRCIIETVPQVKEKL